MGLIKMYARPITYKVNGPGTTQTAEGYVATPVRYSTISVEDLADHISADSRVERSKVAVITDSLIKQIREMVLNGHKIEIPHLGSFKPKIKSAMAINPESVDAAAFTAKVKFTPSVELKRDLQASRIEKTTLPTAPQAPSTDAQQLSIIHDFQKLAAETLKKLDVNVPSTFVECLIGFKDLGASTLVVKGVYEADGKTYTLYKSIKAKSNGTNGAYEFINPSIPRTFNADDYERFEGWFSPVNEWVVSGNNSNYYFSDFYKVTQPFMSEEDLDA